MMKDSFRMIDTQTTLSLIKAAFSSVPSAVDINLSVKEYLTFAKAQQIEAILIIGLHKSGVSLSKDIRNILLQATLMSSRQIKAAQEIYTLFEKNKIDYMPLKGSVLKLLYPSEEMRSMGDIDVLVRQEQYAQIRQLMLSFGFQEGVQSGYEYIWDKDGVHIELHKRLISSFNKDYYAYYGDGWQRARPSRTPFCYEMSHEDTFVYLFTHYAKHYRDAGAGIRQVLDLYVYRENYPQMNESYIQEKMHLLQLDRFYENTLHMVDVWFGEATHTEASLLISDRLFVGGVFGDRESSLNSTMLKKMNCHNSVKMVKALNWLNRVFLPYSGMSQLYPCLKKHPILLPFMWIIRWGNIILHKRNRFQEYVQADSAVNDDSVKAYQEMLRKSGLDFNFE